MPRLARARPLGEGEQRLCDFLFARAPLSGQAGDFGEVHAPRPLVHAGIDPGRVAPEYRVGQVRLLYHGGEVKRGERAQARDRGGDHLHVLRARGDISDELRAHRGCKQRKLRPLERHCALEALEERAHALRRHLPEPRTHQRRRAEADHGPAAAHGAQTPRRGKLLRRAEPLALYQVPVVQQPLGRRRMGVLRGVPRAADAPERPFCPPCGGGTARPAARKALARRVRGKNGEPLRRDIHSICGFGHFSPLRSFLED